MSTKKTYYNASYVSPEVIWANIVSKYKRKQVSQADVIDWCARMEREFIKDVTCMIKYIEQPLQVIGSKVALPSNIHRLTAAYDEDDQPIRYNTNGAYLFDVVDYHGNSFEDENEIYIDYVGLVMDDQCRPMIHEAHSQACEVFCKLQMFEEDYAMGRFNARLYEEWQSSIGGLVQSARGSNYRQFTEEQLNHLVIIKGNMFPRLEKTSVRDEQVYPKRP